MAENGSGPGSPAKARVLAIALVGFVALVYAWFASEGTFTNWPTRTHNYSVLADSFLKGQTSLIVQPDARLLELDDPYSPAQNSRFRYHDAVLYQGKYYFYWGPLPSMLLTPIRLILGRERPPIGDEYMVFVFAVGLVAASSALLLHLRDAHFASQPWWTVGIGIVTVGLGSPMPYLLAWASIYNAAIIGGQCFFILGILCVAVAVRRFARDPLMPGAARWLFTAGVMWVCAVGCRISLGPAVGAAGILVALQLRRCGTKPAHAQESPRSRLAPWVAGTSAMTMPLLVGAISLAWYNSARFGSPFETGVQYMLAGGNTHKMVSRGTFSSAGYIPINLLRGVFELPAVRSRFPFLWPYGFRVWKMAGTNVSGYLVEPVAGMAWATPIFALAAIPMVRSAFRRLANATSPIEKQPLPSIGFLVVLLVITNAISCLPGLSIAVSTMRYLEDAAPLLAILAQVGVWMLLDPGLPAAIRTGHLRALAFLTIWTVTVGLLLGFSQLPAFIDPCAPASACATHK